MKDGTVKTACGTVAGISRDGYFEFLGIPYAKPPVGALRWRAPVPMEPWEGVYQADHFGHKCIQKDEGPGFYKKEFHEQESYEVAEDEDCLYLNIWTPAKKEKDALPVALWIHGGAYLGGHGGEVEFDGREFCKRGVILVTINYRVNIYGFLAHPWLSAENERGISGNYGIFDQIAALEWVYENIRAFGGDPERITVFGQSAGAQSVQTLVSTELTKNRIKGAILQSGGSYRTGLLTDLTLEEAMEYGAQFVALTGAKSLDELRAMTPQELAGAADQFIAKLFVPGKKLALAPNIDQYLLKDGYYALMDQGAVKEIPYLLGSTGDDILVDKKARGEGQPGPLYEGCLAFGQKLAELGRQPAYVYHFTRDLPGDDAGSFHSAELWYMFGTLDRCWRPMGPWDYDLSRQMLDYWTNFIKTGDPNGKGLPRWEPCSGEAETVKELRAG